MKRELRDAWTAKLRSGEIDQGKGALRCIDGKMCVLGVLAVVAGLEIDEKGGDTVNSKGDWSELYELIGLGNRHLFTTIWHNNDGDPCWTFPRLADYIEEIVPVEE